MPFLNSTIDVTISKYLPGSSKIETAALSLRDNNSQQHLFFTELPETKTVGYEMKDTHYKKLL